MSFVRTWLLPRVAFWVMWTAWLWALPLYVLPRLANPASYLTQFVVVGPPIVLTWVGSRFVRNPFDTSRELFAKGAVASCLLGVFAGIFMVRPVANGIEILLGGFLLFGLLAFRGGGIKKIEVKVGELFDRVQVIARHSGVLSARVTVFRSKRNQPAAFAHKLGSILLSDRLLRILSRREVDVVIAHEAAHLRGGQRAVITCLPLLLTALVMSSFFWPSLTAYAFLWPFAGVLLWRAIRRMQEFSADANAVRVTGDPEALITGLTRVSNEAGLPLHWGRFAGLFLSHPPMTARFRAVARRAGLNQARVDELMALATSVPALPGYGSPFGSRQKQNAAPPVLDGHLERMKQRMEGLSKVWPILAGAAIGVVPRFGTFDLTQSIAVIAAWIVGGMLVYWIVYEVLAGSERNRLRRQLPEGHVPRGHFVGLSTAAEPRTFGVSYHYDLGIAAIRDGSLQFNGVRCSFSLSPSQVRRVWMGAGPRHWTPRRTVCIEYDLNGLATAVVSLQSLERWFWPGTTRAARELLQLVTAWKEAGASTSSPVVLPAQEQGNPVTQVTLAQAWKAIRIYGAISLAVAWVIGSLGAIQFDGMLLLFAAPLVTAVLLFFGIAPHLRWSTPRRAPMNPAPAQPPPLPEPER